MSASINVSAPLGGDVDTAGENRVAMDVDTDAPQGIALEVGGHAVHGSAMDATMEDESEEEEIEAVDTVSRNAAGEGRGVVVRLSYPRGLSLVAGRRRAWLTWVDVDNGSKHSVYEETNRWIPKSWGSVALI